MFLGVAHVHETKQEMCDRLQHLGGISGTERKTLFVALAPGVHRACQCLLKSVLECRNIELISTHSITERSQKRAAGLAQVEMPYSDFQEGPPRRGSSDLSPTAVFCACIQQRVVILFVLRISSIIFIRKLK